jgi:hypothetical protein
MSNSKNVAGGSALRIGAVAYDPKVVTIWEGLNILPNMARKSIRSSIRRTTLKSNSLMTAWGFRPC